MNNSSSLWFQTLFLAGTTILAASASASPRVDSVVPKSSSLPLGIHPSHICSVFEGKYVTPNGWASTIAILDDGRMVDTRRRIEEFMAHDWTPLTFASSDRRRRCLVNPKKVISVVSSEFRFSDQSDSMTTIELVGDRRVTVAEPVAVVREMLGHLL